MAQLKDTIIEGVLEIQGKDSEGRALILPEESEIYIGNEPFKGGVSSEEIQQMGFVTNSKIGGEELGLVKNGGNVVINSDGTMTAPESAGSGGASVQSDWNATEAADGAIKNKPPIEKGYADNSIQQTNSIANTDNSIAVGKNNVAGAKGYYILGIEETDEENVVALVLSEQQVASAPPVDMRGDYNTSAMESVVLSSNVLPATTNAEIYIIVPNNHYTFCGTVNKVENNKLYVNNLSLFNPANLQVENIFTFDDLIDYWKTFNNVLSPDWSGTFTDLISQGLVGDKDYMVCIPSQPTWGSCEVTISAHSEGRQSYASGDYSHAEGRQTVVGGGYGHAEGRETIAGYAAHAEGYKTKAGGKYSHTEGNRTVTSGTNSHAEGIASKANGDNSHAEGDSTVAYGTSSHAEGAGSQANGSGSHAEGRNTVAGGWGSHSEGYGSTLFDIKNIGLSANDIILRYNHIGRFLLAKGNYAHAEGLDTLALGDTTHAEGARTKAIGIISHAEGDGATADGAYSHAEGKYTTASGEASHSEGNSTTANGAHSHAEGYYTTASGNWAHAEGERTIASNYGSHAEGAITIAKAGYTHAEGFGTIAGGNSQHVQGKYNIEDTNNDYAHIVGGGTSTTPSNLHTIRWDNGQGFFRGGTTTEGADYAEYFEWQDGNTDNEDRIGLIVMLDGEKIKLANKDDEVLGIISGTAAVLGDNYECEWNGKYLTDDFGRVIYDMVEEFAEIPHVEIDDEGNRIETIETVSLGFFKHPRINPDYDPSKEYVNRADRPEWDTVGMLGKLFVKDDGTCIPNYYATVGENGIATSSLEKTNMRVLSRVNDNVVRVLLK